MRIAYLTPEHPSGRAGGIGHAVTARSRALVRAGHHVVVFGPGPHHHDDDHGVVVRMDPVRHPPRLGWAVVPAVLARRARRLVQDQRIDVLVAPDWLGISADVQPGCPVVVECHGSATYFGDELDEPVRRLVRRSERRSLRGAVGATAVSSHLAARTQDLFGLARPPAVVPNGVDLARFVEADEHGRDPDLVLHVGTLVRKKGVFDAVEALRRVTAVRPGVRMAVVGRDAADRRTGSPSTWRLVADRAADLPVEHRGPLDQTSLADAYATAAVLLVPSAAEAQPLVWLEAMATGLPVVAYDLPWAREVVVDGETGLLVAPGDRAGLADAVAGLLADPARRQAMGRAGAARVRARFAVDDTAALEASVLHELVARAAQVAP